jgi:peptide-methionine (R)-S-oxide reductase
MALAGCAEPGKEAAPARGASSIATTPAPACDALPAGRGVNAAAAPVAGKEPDAMATTDAEWRAKLTPLQYQVLRQEGTERAYTGEYLRHDADGMYRCAGCGTALYDSATKFDQGGWPSFSAALPGAVATRDAGPGALEVHCAKCGGHLGHVFDDGPGPTRKRH